MAFSLAKAYLAAQLAKNQKSPVPMDADSAQGKSAELKHQGRQTSSVKVTRSASRSASPEHKTPVKTRSRAKPSPQVALPSVKLFFRNDLRLGWSPDDTVRPTPLLHNTSIGCKLDLTDGNGTTTRELVMGLDFGTSCTKVVIDDRQMGQRYAVPLVNATGVNSYLLPTRLNEHLGYYTLANEGVASTDLKLALMAAPDDEQICSRVCAYLALVIRASRAWLFTQYRKAFLNNNILWALALGQPADQATSDASIELFHQLGKVAWALASAHEAITPIAALEGWRARETLSANDEVEVVVMPESAAQIHGFVSSQAFDPRNTNIFLMVDIGAGTVDASIFHVRKNPSGTVSFSFFTNSVEAFGAANLHRYRVSWWQKQLAKYEEGKSMVATLESIRLPTEYRGQYPEKFDAYVLGVSPKFIGGEKSPDMSFFKLVRDQVAGGVIYKAWKDGLLTQTAISGIPLFLCGGGRRHVFYRKLKDELQHTPNASWMNAKYRELTLPTDLVAPGLTRADYDRLSVAYGLSRLIPGGINKAPPLMPLVPIAKSSDWRSNYIEK